VKVKTGIRTRSNARASASRAAATARSRGWRVLALNMQHSDLDAYAAEQLHADGVIADVDRGLATLATPAIAIEGAHDRFVA
jgi:hypothetical protein